MRAAERLACASLWSSAGVHLDASRSLFNDRCHIWRQVTGRRFVPSSSATAGQLQRRQVQSARGGGTQPTYNHGPEILTCSPRTSRRAP